MADDGLADIGDLVAGPQQPGDGEGILVRQRRLKASDLIQGRVTIGRTCIGTKEGMYTVSADVLNAAKLPPLGIIE